MISPDQGLTSTTVVSGKLHLVRNGHMKRFVDVPPVAPEPVHRPARVAVMLALAHKILKRWLTESQCPWALVHSRANIGAVHREGGARKVALVFASASRLFTLPILEGTDLAAARQSGKIALTHASPPRAVTSNSPGDPWEITLARNPLRRVDCLRFDVPPQHHSPLLGRPRLHSRLPETCTCGSTPDAAYCEFLSSGRDTSRPPSSPRTSPGPSPGDDMD